MCREQVEKSANHSDSGGTPASLQLLPCCCQTLLAMLFYPPGLLTPFLQDRVYVVSTSSNSSNQDDGHQCRIPSFYCCCCYLVQVPVGLVHGVLTSRPETKSLNQKYDTFALRSFVEENRALVWCTGGALCTGAGTCWGLGHDSRVVQQGWPCQPY